jgi:hypothetical protein
LLQEVAEEKGIKRTSYCRFDRSEKKWSSSTHRYEQTLFPNRGRRVNQEKIVAGFLFSNSKVTLSSLKTKHEDLGRRGKFRGKNSSGTVG